MDLNHLYSEHQIAVMRASASTSRLARTRHLAAAGVFAHHIGTYQRTIGAPAASGWRSGSDGAPRPAPANPGLAL